MEITILIISNILAPIITGFASWLMAKKKYYSEVTSTEISNMKETLDFYKQLSDDNRERLKRVLEKNEQWEREVGELKLQVAKLATNICMDLTCKNRILGKEIRKESN